MSTKIGRVNFPLFAIIKAVPAAIKAAREEHLQNREATSTGGSTVTTGEVAEEVLAFITTLGEQILPVVMKANGL